MTALAGIAVAELVLAAVVVGVRIMYVTPATLGAMSSHVVPVQTYIWLAASVMVPPVNAAVVTMVLPTAAAMTATVPAPDPSSQRS